MTTNPGSKHYRTGCFCFMIIINENIKTCRIPITRQFFVFIILQCITRHTTWFDCNISWWTQGYISVTLLKYSIFPVRSEFASNPASTNKINHWITSTLPVLKPRRVPSIQQYNEEFFFISPAVIESSNDLGSTVSDILARRMQELELRSQLGTSPTWMSLFEENDPNCAGRPRPCASRLSGHSPRPPHRPPRSPASPRRCPQLSLLSSDASLTSDSDSHCSTSPCSRRHGWPEPSSNFPLSSSSPSRPRPRTQSLDAKLSTLRGTLQCPCQHPPSSLLAPFPVSSFSPRSQRSTQTTLSCSSSTSSNSSSNSEGGHSLESSEGAPFSRPSPARRSLRNLKARLDPRNWLQSQVWTCPAWRTCYTGLKATVNGSYMWTKLSQLGHMQSPEENQLPLLPPGGGRIMKDPPGANWNVF